MNLFDIGSNMTHAQFRGRYGRFTIHKNDQEIVFNRAKAYGVKR